MSSSEYKTRQTPNLPAPTPRWRCWVSPEHPQPRQRATAPGKCRRSLAISGLLLSKILATSAFIWDKIGMHRVHGVQITTACFSSWYLWLWFSLQGPACIQLCERKKPPWEQGVSISNPLGKLNRIILKTWKKYVPVPNRYISLCE